MSKVASVTSVAIVSFRFLVNVGLVTQASNNKNASRLDLPSRWGSQSSSLYRTNPTIPGSSEEMLARWEARGNVREAARAEQRRADLLLHRRAGHGERAARRPHGLGADAEGRLPALQGAARLRPALPERLRLARGCWIEVGVEQRARLQLEARDRGVRARRSSRASAATSSSKSPAGSYRAARSGSAVDGLGQRLLHLQRHEHRVHLADAQGGARDAAGSTWATARPSGARAAARRSRSTSWPARRTTRSSRRSVALRPLPVARPATGESLVIWTTTPWTLPANVAAAVNPDAEYGRRDERRVGRGRRAIPTRSSSSERKRGSELVGWTYGGRSTTSRRDRASSTASSRGTRSRSTRAPASSTSRRAAAPRTSSSRVSTTCRCSRRSTSRGGFYDRLRLARRASTTDEVADQIIGSSRSAGLLVEAGVERAPLSRSAGAATRRSSSASSDDWFISADDIRQQMLDANATVEWTPPQYMGKRMDDWLRNMGDWNISRRRYYGLPLPVLSVRVRAPERDRVARRARGARRLGARAARGAAPAVDRRASPSAARAATPRSSGSRKSATSGSTPASSSSRRSVGRTPSGSRTATRRARPPGSTGADLPDNAYWEKWFPADWVSEGREQIRLWFYSQFFMAVALVGPPAVRPRARLREDARRDRAARCTSRGGTRSSSRTRSRGWAPTSMRWQYCSQTARARSCSSASGRRRRSSGGFLTFWNSVKFFVDYANIVGFRPSWPPAPPEGLWGRSPPPWPFRRPCRSGTANGRARRRRCRPRRRSAGRPPRRSARPRAGFRGRIWSRTHNRAGRAPARRKWRRCRSPSARSSR